MTPDKSAGLPQNVLTALWRQKIKAMVVFGVMLGVAVVLTLLSPKVYRSEAKLLVRLGRENVALDPTASLGQPTTVAVPNLRESEINSIVDILRSRALAEKVVDAMKPATLLSRAVSDSSTESSSSSLGYARLAAATGTARKAVGHAVSKVRVWSGVASLPEREQAVQSFTQSMGVAAGSKTNVIDISFEADSPELAQAVVARTVTLYCDEHVRLNRTAQSHPFFVEQAKVLELQLAREEDELRTLKNSTGLAMPEKQREMLVQRVNSLENELLRTETAQAISETRLKELRRQLATLAPTQVSSSTTGSGHHGTDLMQQEYYALRIKEEEAAAKHTDMHPKMQEIRRQVAAAGEILNRAPQDRTQVTTAPDKTYEEIRLAILKDEPTCAALRAEAKTLRAQIAAANNDLRAFNDNELRVVRLQREIQLHEADYKKYAVSSEQARIDQAMETQRISNISIAEPATYSLKPVRPKILFNLALGFAAAMFGAVVVAVACDGKDHSLHSPEDITRHIDLATLTSIPRFRQVPVTSNGNRR